MSAPDLAAPCGRRRSRGPTGSFSLRSRDCRSTLRDADRREASRYAREGFEPSRDVPGRSLPSLPGLRLAGFESSDTLGFTRARGASRALRTAHACEISVRGKEFEPKPDVLAPCGRCARLAGFELPSHSHGYSRSFEPASARGGIRTHEPLRERILSPLPLS